MVKSVKSSSSKKHEDRQLLAKTTFDSTTIDIQTPLTMILLLASKEDLVVLKALASLDAYASKFEQNALALYSEGILRPLLPLLEHQNPSIQRFATKLLSELSFQQPVAEFLLEEQVIPSLMTLMNNFDDLIIKEFTSSIVGELTKTTAGHDQLLSSGLIHTLVPNLMSSDCDVQKNSLQIMSNMVQDPYKHTWLTDAPEFSLKPFIDLVMSEYPAIQNLSLDILNILTQRRKENSIPKQFQDAGGVARLQTILKNFEWKDIHAKCLEILGNIYDNPDVVQHNLKDAISQLFHYIEIMYDPHLVEGAVQVICKFTNSPQGRKLVVESGNIAKIAGMILNQNLEVSTAACDCVAGLSKDTNGLQQLLELGSIKDLLRVLADTNRTWDNRTAAANALYHILERDCESCKLLLDLMVQETEKDVFQSILGEYEETVPVQAPVTVSNLITAIARVAELKNRLVSKSLIASLLHCFKDFKVDTMPLKLAACEALCSLLTEPQTRNYLSSLDGLTIVWKSVTKYPNNTQFLQSAAMFVHLCVANDNRFTTTLLQLGVIKWLLSQSSLRNECPAWEMALESVFNHFLPYKFAFTGRLELTDITEDGFYITRFPLTRAELDKNCFPILTDLVQVGVCPVQTIYVANFEDKEIPRDSLVSSEFERSFSFKKSSSTMSKTVSGSLESSRATSFTDLSCVKDVYLLKYQQSLKEILKKNRYSEKGSYRKDEVADGDTIRGKARLIAQFVANQMSGLDETQTCTKHMLELHINELKVELMNSIIPVGWMRCGLHTERAFLFKVLADQVGLPACLVRGRYAPPRTWVEVCIPVLPLTQRPAYPNMMLRPNHVVDLINDPGALYPLHSDQANLYCGLI